MFVFSFYFLLKGNFKLQIKKFYLKYRPVNYVIECI